VSLQRDWTHPKLQFETNDLALSASPCDETNDLCCSLRCHTQIVSSASERRIEVIPRESVGDASLGQPLSLIIYHLGEVNSCKDTKVN
jgi:hypothetical protein